MRFQLIGSNERLYNEIIKGIRIFVWEIAVKIPYQKTHLGNLTCDFLDDCSIKIWKYGDLPVPLYQVYGV